MTLFYFVTEQVLLCSQSGLEFIPSCLKPMNPDAAGAAPAPGSNFTFVNCKCSYLFCFQPCKPQVHNIAYSLFCD